MAAVTVLLISKQVSDRAAQQQSAVVDKSAWNSRGHFSVAGLLHVQHSLAIHRASIKLVMAWDSLDKAFLQYKSSTLIDFFTLTMPYRKLKGIHTDTCGGHIDTISYTLLRYARVQDAEVSELELNPGVFSSYSSTPQHRQALLLPCELHCQACCPVKQCCTAVANEQQLRPKSALKCHSPAPHGTPGLCLLACLPTVVRHLHSSSASAHTHTDQ